MTRFTTEEGRLILVEVPEESAKSLIAAALEHDTLQYGDYDQVAMTSSIGTQQFRALGTGRHAATEEAVTVPCVALRFFTNRIDGALSAVIEALYSAHPYEEPVIYLLPVTRTLHIRGQDEDNPNRFWNRETPDWVPQPHR